MSSMLEVTQQIKIDHDNVRDLLQRFKSETDGETKKAIASILIKEMIIHGDAEDISVYNKYKEMGLGDTAEHNREEHAEVKKLVHQADEAHCGSSDYDKILIDATMTFISHAEEEETQQFDKIKAALSPQENDKMAREFLKARTTVRTRPPPQAGGMAINLKFSHPEI